jgi:CRISPR/Cas system-associated protein Csm6
MNYCIYYNKTVQSYGGAINLFFLQFMRAAAMKHNKKHVYIQVTGALKGHSTVVVLLVTGVLKGHRTVVVLLANKGCVEKLF